ncbi:MAG TPA: arsenate reductase ArsC [Chryseolinea sp.]|nr:arsenate reductase ArsC [Chryseolinea sp.]
MNKSKKHRVLFVCIHNSARSQMAEAFLKKYGEGAFEAESAGIEPGKLNPNVVTVMAEKDIDLHGKSTQSVFSLVKEGRQYDAVITVCDREAAERCPVFPGVVKRIAWSFEDPSSFSGERDEILARTRVIRNNIEQTVRAFVKASAQAGFWNPINQK